MDGWTDPQINICDDTIYRTKTIASITGRFPLLLNPIWRRAPVLRNKARENPLNRVLSVCMINFNHAEETPRRFGP